MTVQRFRSMTEAITDGATDGKYRKRRPDTTVYPGDGDDLVMRQRASLNPFMNYGLINDEYADKVNPGEM